MLSMSGYTFNDHASFVDIPMLIFHGDGGAIIPAQFSHQFAMEHPDWIESFWYKRSDTAPWESIVTIRGKIYNARFVQLYFTIASIFLMLNLATSSQPILVPYGGRDAELL